MASVIEQYRQKFGKSGEIKTPSLIEQYRSRFPQTRTAPTTIDLYREKQGIVPRTNDLKSSDGLYNLAVQSGLKDKADSILASQKGEETKKIYSGGFISDIFDTLNALQYGVTGTLKGKGFLEDFRGF